MTTPPHSPEETNTVPVPEDDSVPAPQPPRPTIATVIVVSTNSRRSWAVVDYVRDLVAHDVKVELVVLNRRKWRALSGLPTVRFHQLRRAEERALVWRLERLLVYRIPGKAMALAGKVAVGPIRPAVAALHRGQRRVSGAFHTRVFMGVYRPLRAQVLARMFRAPLRSVEMGPVDRIVASDIDSVTLAWRLARRFPNATVTTSLERGLLPSLSPGPQG